MAFWVLGYHLRGLRATPFPDLFGILERGYLGVDFFFILSGFILTTKYGETFSGRFSLRDYGRFLTVRAARIFPLHIAVTLACVATGRYPLAQVMEELFLVHRWPGVPAYPHAINGPAWSISTELFVNLIFPLVTALTIVPPRRIAVAVLVGSVGVLAWTAARHGWSLDITTANSIGPTLRCLTEFMIGGFVSRWYKTPLDEGRAMIPALAASGILLLAFDACDLTLIPIFSLLIPLLIQNKSRIAQIFSIRPLMWIGNLSFSVYLTQEPILLAVRRVAQSSFTNKSLEAAFFVTATVAATLVASYFSNRFIEKPGQRLGRSLFSGTRTR